jgi:para-nitrobenzyl esterase
MRWDIIGEFMKFRCLTLAVLSFAFTLQAKSPDKVKTKAGAVRGAINSDGTVRIFKGIPFAQPPVGPLRWKAPQPVTAWAGTREATAFGPRCMQGNVYGDMNFRDSGPSEDCLYLNVWAPMAATKRTPLPVMVWIYGGGFVAGASSEPRQDGEVLAKKGVVVVSFNYRLGIFGFFAHPGLARETGRNGSGNYGLLDQAAALAWVQQNIKAFGGDPANVTIFGESAGSFSVSALLASPLSKDLFKRAIGESGAYFGTSLAIKSAAEAQMAGAQFASSLGASSIEELRAKPAVGLLQASLKDRSSFSTTVDGSFFPESLREIYAAGKQAHVPLLAGWNADEGSAQTFFGKDPQTVENFRAKVRERYKDDADRILALYPAASDQEVKQSAGALASDGFIAYSTWKWLELQRTTGQSIVYRYEFDDAPPATPSRGAYHSAEIEFVFEALPSKNLPWRPEDFKLSDLMSSYWTNFAKSGDPNGPGLPQWPVFSPETGNQVMHLSSESKAAPEQNRARYEFLDGLNSKK